MINDQNQDFKCLNCRKWVSTEKLMGTQNRNHCPFCLYSKHVDLDIPGDRQAKCQNLMKPIGLTFKKEGKDKYGKEKQGEIMLIHFCPRDKKISLNRIAGDDDPEMILKIFQESQDQNPEIKNEILKQLYGKN